jgi:hypothetical protein
MRRRPLNSVIEPSIDVESDIKAINQGTAIRRGNTYEIHGRRYGVEQNGRAYPIDGPGIHQLGRGAYRALQLYNEHGLSPDADRMLDLEKIDAEERERARHLWRLGQR